MTRVAREFENLMLAVRSSVAAHRPATCELLDSMIEKTKQCFAAQKSSHKLGLQSQVGIPLLGLLVPSLIGYGLSLHAWTQNFGKQLSDSDLSTRLQWSTKTGDFVKSWIDANGYDHQAMQKQIDNTSAELAASNQGQATFLQSLETAMQRHQQILENAKR